MRLIPQSVIAHLSGEGCSNYTFFVFFLEGLGVGVGNIAIHGEIG